MVGHDYKSALQERLQALGRALPEYRVASTTGPDHRKVFTIEVCVDGAVVASATGLAKKLAEQEAVVQRERVEAALREADDQRNRALLEKRDADEVAGFMLDLFATPDPDQARGHEPSARELLASGVRRIETELVDQPAVRARLLQRMGRSYASLGLHAEAEPLLERAIELQRGLFGERDLATIESTFFLARSLRLAHRAGAVPLLWRALEVYEELVGPDDEHTLDVLVELAAALAAEGQPAEARALLEREEPGQRQPQSAERPNPPPYRRAGCLRLACRVWRHFAP